jgi:hypothetical protein
MANIQIADLAQVENQFDELSDLELEVVGGRSRWRPPVSQSWWFRPSNAIIWY